MQSVLAPWYAVDGHVGVPLHWYMPLKVGWIIGKLGVWLSLSDTSWLKLQSPIDCIPHPYYVHTKCLASWYAVDKHMGVPLCWYASEGGVDYWEIGGMAESKWCCKVMVDASKPHSLHPTSILYIYKVFSTLICCGWTCGCTLTLICLWRWGGLLGNWGYGWVRVML